MIQECLDSLQAQTFRDFEVNVYDDGSTDNTHHFVRNHPIAKSHKVSFYKGDKNRGVGYARNQLLNSVETDFACWQDSDDKSAPERLGKQIDFLYRKPDKVLVMTNIVWYDKSWTRKQKISGADVLSYCPEAIDPFRKKNVAFASSMFRSKLLKNDFKEGLIAGEDTEWLRRVIKAYPEGFACIEENLYLARIHENRLSVLKRKKHCVKR
jgi:glycosyltransferase involved in cell wall biosynthesis